MAQSITSLPHRLEDLSLSLNISVKSRCVLQTYDLSTGKVDTESPRGSPARLVESQKQGREQLTEDLQDCCLATTHEEEHKGNDREDRRGHQRVFRA